MKCVTDDFETGEFRSRLMDLYFGGARICVYDIETTGLFPRNDRIMLTGLLTVENSRAHAVQYFAESLNDEKALLEETIKELEKADVVVTYNGRSFDIPFTVTRAAKYGLKCDMPYDLDLFTVLSGYSEIKKFTGSLSQKSIEKFMGTAPDRDDRIDGRESIRLYEKYLESPSYALEKTIMLHNHDDICQLYRILPVIRQTDFHRAMFRMGFPGGGCIIKTCKVSGGVLYVNAVRMSGAVDYISFPTESAPYSLRMSSGDGSVELEIPCESVANDTLVIDAKTILEGLGGTVEPSQYIDAGPSGDGRSSMKELFEYPAFESGYLIVKSGQKVNYLETNMFVKEFFRGLRV